jgi:hypothetical protein
MSDTRSPDLDACPTCGAPKGYPPAGPCDDTYHARPDLDARLSEDVEKGAQALETARGVRGLFDTTEQRELAAIAVLSAANHAERLAERERARLWIGYAMEELTAEQITRVTERAEYEGESLLDRVRVLEEALRPFADIAPMTDWLGHEPGSTCAWRLAYDDLNRARRALASSLETDTEDGGRDGD